MLKIDTGGERLPIMPLATGDQAQVGDLVLAIGDPFGVGQTVTNGIVSALARSNVGLTDVSYFIQTDAAINPGNSGGALVEHGRRDDRHEHRHPLPARAPRRASASPFRPRSCATWCDEALGGGVVHARRGSA